MTVFLESVSLVLAFLVVHAAIWRLAWPKRPIHTLLVLAALVFCLWLAFRATRPEPWPGMLRIALFFWSVSLSYAITYGAIELDSPTLSLMLFLAEERSRGRSLEEIATFSEQRPFIRLRIATLLRSSLIREENGRYFARRPSRAFRLILGFRRVYGPMPHIG